MILTHCVLSWCMWLCIRPSGAVTYFSDGTILLVQGRARACAIMAPTDCHLDTVSKMVQVPSCYQTVPAIVPRTSNDQDTVVGTRWVFISDCLGYTQPCQLHKLIY